MATFMDRSSPRRGLSTSLNKNASCTTTTTTTSNGNSSSPVSNSNNASNNHLYKDLDKFTRYFLIKTVQVIVQSRLGGEKGVRTECKPTGNDWFNLNITDIKEVSEQSKAVLDKLSHGGFTIKTSWRVCCEISVRTNEGRTIVLELWIITNRSKLNDSVASVSQPTFNSNKKEFNSNEVLCSNILPGDTTRNSNGQGNESFINNGSLSGMRCSYTEQHMDKASCASSSGLRSALVDNNENMPSQTETFARRNETLLRDIKASVSCTSLSSAANNAPNAMNSSPSANFLAGHKQQPSLPSKNNYSSSTIYSIYNKMSLTLKTLITTTRISPAFQLANRGQSANSYIVCYRIFACSPESSVDLYQKNGSVDHLASKKSPLLSNINIREFVGEEDEQRFSPFTKLGSIRSDLNDLDISLSYRTDMRDSHDGRTDSRTTQEIFHRNQFDEECITAAKQLLLANNCSTVNGNKLDTNVKDFDKSSIGSNERFEFSLKDLDRPLCAAFASEVAMNRSSAPVLTVLEPAFTTLLPPKSTSNTNDKSNGQNGTKEPTSRSGLGGNAVTTDQSVQSKPIQIPPGHAFGHLRDSPTKSGDSAPKSLTDSYVFVDLNPPFATDDQSDLNSFFHGPSPTFSNGFDVLKDVNELTNQLAVLEANVEQIDDFVDTICASENEDDDDICDHLAAVTGGCSFAAQGNQSSKQKGDQNMMKERCRTVSDDQINMTHIQSI